MSKTRIISSMMTDRQDAVDCELLNAIAGTYVRFGHHQKALDMLSLSQAIYPKNDETLNLIAIASLKVDQPSLALDATSMLEKISGPLSKLCDTLRNRAKNMITN